MENIYNAIQNVYNMDKTTWQEVLAELYNLVSNVENKFDLFENKFSLLLGEEVTIELKKMYDDGSLAALINDKLLKDINAKVDTFKTEVSSQLDKIDSKINVNLIDFSNYVNNDDYSLALQKAIDFVFENGGGVVEIPCGVFKVKDIIIKRNVTVRGQGYLSTTLKAIDSYIIKHDVNSILNGGNGDTSGWKLEGVRLHGADLKTDICLFRGNNAHIVFKDVYFYATFGSALNCVEFFDIRYENCFFYWCGNSDGSKPVIDWRNEDGYEYNNNQYFYGCVFEGNRGKIINCNSNNNTEFKFTNCKIENNESIVTQLDFNKCGEISFSDTFVAGNGNDVNATIPNIVSFKNVSGIHGNLTVYKWDRTVKSNITNLVLIDSCSKYDININIFRECECVGNFVQVNTPARDGSFVKVTGINTQGNNREKLSKQYYDFFGDVVIDSKSETSLRLKRNNKNSWEIGRLVESGNDSTFKLIYNNASGETKFIEIFGADKLMRIYSSSLVIPKGDTNPNTQSGGIYFNTTTNKFMGYNGTSWVELG